MSLDLSYEHVLSGDEVMIELAIGQEELNGLEERGLRFIQIGDDCFYLGSTLLAFLKEIEGKGKKRRSRKKVSVGIALEDGVEPTGG